MSRACVIVLDGVGAGALPDADEIRGRGVEHARKRRAAPSAGSTSPNLEALGLGNVAPLEGCPPQPGAPGRRGPAARALERQGHDDRPLGADGRRHAAADAHVPARIPLRGDRPVHAPHGQGRARQQAGLRAPRSSRSSARSTSAPASGSSTPPPTRCSSSRRTRRRSRSKSSTTPASSPARC